MTEQQPRPINLTNQTNLNRLEGERIIMPEPGGQEQQAPITPRQEEVIQEAVNPPEGIDRPAEEAAGISPRRPEHRESHAERVERTFEEFTRSIQTKDTLSQLASDTPDFAKTPELKKFVDELEPGGDLIRYFADFITNPEQDYVDEEGARYRISTASRRVLFEWALEKIIGLPEQGSPEARYSIDSFQARENLTLLKALSLSRFNNEFSRYIGSMIEIREMAHELRRNLTQGDAYKEFMQKELKAHGIDFMRNEVSGVKDVISLYELFTGLKVSQKREWLSAGDVEDIDHEVKEAIMALKGKSQIKQGERPLTDWEIDRALSIGKTLFAGTQRFAMYTVLGSIPTQTAERAGSVPYEYIVRTLAPIKITAARYFTSAGQRYLQERILDNYKNGKKTSSLFGIAENSWAMNNFNAFDVESHSWRSQLMFLGDMRFRIKTGEDAEGNPVYKEGNVLEYFNDELTRLAESTGAEYDPALGLEGGSDKEFSNNENVAALALGQKLYLSVLGKYSPFSEELKRGIYRKIAIYDPLAFTSLSPEVLSSLSPEQKRVWQGMAIKMGMANSIRLRKEGEEYFDEHEHRKTLDIDSLKQEAGETYDFSTKKLKDVSQISDDYKYQILSKYFSEEYGNALTGEEQEVLKTIIRTSLSGEFVNNVVSAEKPFTFIIDDAPHVAWSKTRDGVGGLGDENLFRILLSDQGNLAESWGALNGLIEHPPADPSKAFITFVQKRALVTGRGEAQGKLEPFLNAWLDMASTYDRSKWIGAIEKATRHPRSEMEKFYRGNYISMDEQDKSIFLDSLAQQGAIGTNIARGPSQLEELKKRNKAYIIDNLRRSARMILLLLGPTLGIQFLKLIFPDEITKGLK